MRYTVALLMLVTGCSKGDAGPAGERGEQGLQGPPGMMGNPGKDAERQKVPHLIGLNGEDLGLAIGGNCAFNEKVGAEVCFELNRMYFVQPDCAGDAVPGFGAYHAKRKYVGPNGRVFSLTVGEVPIAIKTRSEFWSSGCVNFQQPIDGIGTDDLMDTGVTLGNYKPTELSVELR